MFQPKQTANHRITGSWFGGITFLICVGRTREDCLGALFNAAEEYTGRDLLSLSGAEIEEWIPNHFDATIGRWKTIQSICGLFVRTVEIHDGIRSNRKSPYRKRA